jgi:hypothetical protein
MEPLKTSLRSFLEFLTLFFWLKEGVLSVSYMLFFATPSSRPPTHWVFRGAPLYTRYCSIIRHMELKIQAKLGFINKKATRRLLSAVSALKPNKF